LAHAVFEEGTRALGALCAFSHSATPPQHALGRSRRFLSCVWRQSASSPNRTCAGHKPSGPSRQATNRCLAPTMSRSFQM